MFSLLTNRHVYKIIRISCHIHQFLAFHVLMKGASQNTLTFFYGMQWLLHILLRLYFMLAWTVYLLCAFLTILIIFFIIQTVGRHTLGTPYESYATHPRARLRVRSHWNVVQERHVQCTFSTLNVNVLHLQDVWRCHLLFMAPHLANTVHLWPPSHIVPQCHAVWCGAIACPNTFGNPLE